MDFFLCIPITYTTSLKCLGPLEFNLAGPQGYTPMPEISVKIQCSLNMWAIIQHFGMVSVQDP